MNTKFVCGFLCWVLMASSPFASISAESHSSKFKCLQGLYSPDWSKLFSKHRIARVHKNLERLRYIVFEEAQKLMAEGQLSVVIDEVELYDLVSRKMNAAGLGGAGVQSLVSRIIAMQGNIVKDYLEQNLVGQFDFDTISRITRLDNDPLGKAALAWFRDRPRFDIDGRQIRIVYIKGDQLEKSGVQAFALFGRPDNQTEEDTTYSYHPFQIIESQLGPVFEIPLRVKGFRNLVHNVNQRVFGAPHIIAVGESAIESKPRVYQESLVVHELRHVGDKELLFDVRPEFFARISRMNALATYEFAYFIILHQDYWYDETPEVEVLIEAEKSRLLKQGIAASRFDAIQSLSRSMARMSADRMAYQYDDYELKAHGEQVRYLKAAGLSKEEVLEMMVPVVFGLFRGIPGHARVISDLYDMPDHVSMGSSLALIFRGLKEKLELSAEQASLMMYFMITLFHHHNNINEIALYLFNLDENVSGAEARRLLASTLTEYIVTSRRQTIRFMATNSSTGQVIADMTPQVTFHTLMHYMETSQGPSLNAIYQDAQKDLLRTPYNILVWAQEMPHLARKITDRIVQEPNLYLTAFPLTKTDLVIEGL